MPRATHAVIYRGKQVCDGQLKAPMDEQPISPVGGTEISRIKRACLILLPDSANWLANGIESPARAVKTPRGGGVTPWRKTRGHKLGMMHMYHEGILRQQIFWDLHTLHY